MIAFIAPGAVGSYPNLASSAFCAVHASDAAAFAFTFLSSLRSTQHSMQFAQLSFLINSRASGPPPMQVFREQWFFERLRHEHLQSIGNDHALHLPKSSGTPSNTAKRANACFPRKAWGAFLHNPVQHLRWSPEMIRTARWIGVVTLLPVPRPLVLVAQHCRV